MAIARGTARLLLDELRERPFSGSVLQLGRMLVCVSEAELSEWASEQGVPLRALESWGLSHHPDLARQGCLDDKTFFRALGFDEVVACDISDQEGAEILLDLNQPVPEKLHGSFDVVFEAGTIQHVFHLPNVFRNIHALLKPGGRVIHGMSPSHNHVDHGFYMFSPTLFHDYYSANAYRIEASYVFEYRPAWYRNRLLSRPWKIYRYAPGALDHLSYGGFSDEQLGIFFVATKTEAATDDVIPQQSAFGAGRMFHDIESSGRGDRSPDLGERLMRRRWLSDFFVRGKTLRNWAWRKFLRRKPPLHARY